MCRVCGVPRSRPIVTLSILLAAFEEYKSSKFMQWSTIIYLINDSILRLLDGYTLTRCPTSYTLAGYWGRQELYSLTGGATITLHRGATSYTLTEGATSYVHTHWERHSYILSGGATSYTLISDIFVNGNWNRSENYVQNWNGTATGIISPRTELKLKRKLFQELKYHCTHWLGRHVVMYLII